ncbi:MAG: DUF2252 domain-containing protein [Bacteroidetes bacterium]|nr:DUF2252 domain-containing protein [Bacteroidota bacterium]
MAKRIETQSFSHHLTRAERRAIGKALRDTCPRVSHAGWKPAADRPDPLHIVKQSNVDRLPELIPLRHGRMSATPFTFYRGSALAMAADLSATPSTGYRVQCCGDAHLSNFGGFATPERQVIFSVNDLDETLPAPWEWDVKRLAASFVVASRNNGYSDASAADVVRACVRSYRMHMAELSELSAMERWYAMLDSNDIIASVKDPAMRKRLIKRIEKARNTDPLADIFPKIAEHTNGQPTIRDMLPTMYHPKGTSPGQIDEILQEGFDLYRKNLDPAFRLLLDRYELKDAAVKVVGVGSVGTRCFVMLLMSGDGSPLFLQVKEARQSALAPYAGKSKYVNNGERIVRGYRLMQPASDIFLGWSEGRGGRHFFVRQLRDVKIKPLVETWDAATMEFFAGWYGYALALSHARCADPSIISGYLGKSDTFDKALVSFSIDYADQNERDHATFRRAIKSGKLKVQYDPVP